MGRLFQQQARGGRVLLFQDVTKIVHLEEKLKQNEEKAKKGEEIKIDHAHLNSNDVLKVLIEKSQLQIADVLLEEEVKNMLNQLMQQVKSIGLKFEDYLKAQQTTYENIENNYKLIAQNNLKAEFILNKMIKEQNIEVEEKEIDQSVYLR